MKAWTHWTEEDDAKLREYWANGIPVRKWFTDFPGRSQSSIFCRAHALGLPARNKTVQRDECVTWRMIQRVLSDGVARSSKELSILTGFHSAYISLQLKRHHREHLHISEWVGHRAKMPRYTLGPGEDTPKPAPISHSAASAKWRKKMLNERPEMIDAKNARRRLRYAERAGTLIRRDPAAAWI
ncbi:GcrA family cell cycle regulator [Cupriavidus basilensis]|uniref:GcrA family cell cycle regulator n=1 Tax=Cupriavidus basilensis TaxID=68895 RepID=UPI0012E06754|nr:GcrA family cell cycle regulator [Cupriavidus basilensis]